MSRDPTDTEWEIAMANAIELAGTAELVNSDDPRGRVLACLEKAMNGAGTSSAIRTQFAAVALDVIDRRRHAFRLPPLDRGRGFPDVARVFRGHPSGLMETRAEQLAREEIEDDA